MSAATTIAVYPQLGQTYPDANDVPITSVGALVSISDYILLAIDEGYLLTQDPLQVGEPDDRTSIVTPPAVPDLGGLEVVAVYPQEGKTYLDANSVPITAAGAIVSISQYILDAIDAGYLLTVDPLNLYLPEDRTEAPTAGAPADAGYVTIGSFLGLSNERSLTAGAGITITDNGPESTVVIATTNVGDVVGPAIAADHALARFDGTTGKLIQSGPATLSDAGNLTGLTGVTVTGNIAVSGTVDGVDVSTLNSTVAGKVTGPTVVPVTDNAVTRFDGTTGLLVQNSVVTIGDTGAVAGVTGLDVVGNITVSGTVDGVDVSADHAVAYVTVGNTATLPNERALAATSPIVLTDGGAGASATLSAPTVVVGPVSAGDNQIVRFDGTTGKLVQDGVNSPTIDDSGNIVMVGAATVDGVDVSALPVPSYLTLGTSTALLNERVLTPGTNISFVDGGAGSTLTINGAATGAPTTASYLTLATDGTLTNERVLTAGSGTAFTDTGAGGTLTIRRNDARVPRSTSYTLALSDENTMQELSNTTEQVVTLPSDATANLSAGVLVDFLQYGAAQWTFVADAGATINSNGTVGRSFRTRERGCVVTAWKRAANAWYLFGDLEPVQAIVFVNTGSYTVLRQDANKLIRVDTSAGTSPITTITIDAAAAIPPGARLSITQNSTSAVLIAATGGAQIRGFAGGYNYVGGQFQTITIYHLGSSIWQLESGNSLQMSHFRTPLGITADFTLTDVQAGTEFNVNSPSTVTVTIPTAAASGISVGTEYLFYQQSAGQVSIVAAGGVTLNLPPGVNAKTKGVGSTIRLYNFAANNWTLTGDLEETTSYLTLGTSTALLNERVLTAGTNISIVDAGAGSTVTVSTVTGSQAVVATQGPGQALSAATLTTVTLATEVSDNNNNFASNTYTVPATGLYQINLNIIVGSGAASGFMYLGVNGSAQQPGAVLGISAGGGFQTANQSMVRSLTAGNTLTMLVSMTNATTVTAAQFDVYRIA